MSFESYPNDILINIFPFMDGESICRLAMCQQRLNILISNQNRLWKQKIKDHFPLVESNLPDCMQSYQYLSTVMVGLMEYIKNGSIEDSTDVRKQKLEKLMTLRPSLEIWCESSLDLKFGEMKCSICKSSDRNVIFGISYRERTVLSLASSTI